MGSRWPAPEVSGATWRHGHATTLGHAVHKKHRQRHRLPCPPILTNGPTDRVHPIRFQYRLSESTSKVRRSASKAPAPRANATQLTKASATAIWAIRLVIASVR